ncbi:MAG: hypothetical protein OXC93_02680 [Rhodospirillaceae bacterium]|nr:hypothetical protein [Rhodospirillaceae bacterium]
MRKDDEIRLLHMLDAAREAVGFSRGRTRGDLDNDRELVLALASRALPQVRRCAPVFDRL